MKNRILALTLIVALTSAIVCAGDNSAGGVSTEENFAFIIGPGEYAEGLNDLYGTIGQGYYDIVWFITLGAGNLHLEVEDCCIMGDTMVATGDLIMGGPAPFLDWATSPDIISINVSVPDFALGYMVTCYIDAPGGFPAGYYWRADMGCGPSDIVGTWDLIYDWDPPGSPSTTWWEFFADGTFIDGQGNGGTYTVVGDQLTATYSVGTVYTGTISGTYMSGTMLRWDGGLAGTWEAFKTSLPSTEASQDDSGIDADGN
jgi:hypothetical protein